MSRQLELEQEVSDLKWEIKRLRRLISPAMSFKPDLRLTPNEIKFLNFLLYRSPKFATSRDIMEALFSDVDNSPEYNFVNMYTHRVRKKLKSAGIFIETKWGEGIRLDEENAQRLLEYRV